MALASPGARASDDTYPGFERGRQEIEAAALQDLASDASWSFLAEPAPLALSPQEAFARAQSVLSHLGLAPEADPQPSLDPLARHQTLAGAQGVLKAMDPTHTFTRFAQPLGAASVDVAQDIDSRQVPDFGVALAQGAAELPADPSSFHQRLLKARFNPPSKPLTGLRIAIDPGHMGGAFWDRETGKQVHDNQGRWLSEGVLNLQVALLLEQAFRALGAEVLLTHRDLGPVSHADYPHLDFRGYGLRYLRDETLVGWFQNLLAAGPAGSSALFAAVDQSAAIQKTLSDNIVNRGEYFIRGEDLIARSDAINAFDADIALVIHFDAGDAPGDPNGINPTGYDATKVYVVGSYEPAELSSREERAYFGRHLLDAASWDASLKLGRAVVSHLHDDLHLAFDRGGGGFSNQVEPGVFGRNLGVSRRVTDRALTYVECLYYNNPTEFAALYDAHHPMQISGESRPYSDRLAQVAQAIQAGVLGFVSHYGD